jgi:hypothetical protein
VKAGFERKETQMTTPRFLVMLLAAAVAVGGVTVAVADDGDDNPEAFEAVDLRKDDGGADAELVDDDVDDDPTGDGDKTRGDDGTRGGDNTDGDRTGGDDGTRGGDNSEVAAAAPVAPAPAPAYDDYSDDGGAVYSGS